MFMFDDLTGNQSKTLAVLGCYIGSFVIAATVAAVLTPLMRRLALRKGIIDYPDLKRRSVIGPVAYLGGAAIFGGWLVGMAACLWLYPHEAMITTGLTSAVPFPVAVVLGAGIIVFTGLIDDIYGLSPRVKLIGQLIAAAGLATQGTGAILVHDLFQSVGFEASAMVYQVLGVLLVAGFVLGGCNSVNLLDGMDGLAAGVVAIACLGLAAIAVIAALFTADPAVVASPAELVSSPVRIVMCLALLGAILGFLPFNISPARIFMGDAGSLLLGYLCAATILLFAHVPGNSLIWVAGALIVFALPIVDTIMAIVRRGTAGRLIYRPDQQHLHHQLLCRFKARGHSGAQAVRLTVATLWMIAAGFAMLGTIAVLLRWRLVLPGAAVLLLLAVVVGIRGGRSSGGNSPAAVDSPEQTP